MSPAVEQTAGEAMAWGRSSAGGRPAEEWAWQEGRCMRLLNTVPDFPNMYKMVQDGTVCDGTSRYRNIIYSTYK